MSANPQHARTGMTVGRLVTRTALTVIGVVGGLFAYFICQGMVAGYPKYHTDVLSKIGVVLISVIGGIGWLIDERRIRDDG